MSTITTECAGASTGTYRELIAELMLGRSEEKVTCRLPGNVAAALSLFLNTAERAVRIFDARPDRTVYNDLDLLASSTTFLQRGGRIQFCYSPFDNQELRMPELLRKMRAGGGSHAQAKIHHGLVPESVPLAVMDETAYWILQANNNSVFCANGASRARELIQSFDAAYGAR